MSDTAGGDLAFGKGMQKREGSSEAETKCILYTFIVVGNGIARGQFPALFLIYDSVFFDE